MSGENLRRISYAISLVGVLLAVSAPQAGAAEGKPLTITDFTLQTTRPVKVAGPLTRDNYGFVNEPYSFTQAGGHPAALTFTTEFESKEIGGHGPLPTRDPKDIAVALPPGLLGNPTAVPECPLKQALSLTTRCPASTQVGVAVVNLLGGIGLLGPIVNVTPEAGQSAEFAIETSHKISILLVARLVRAPEGYGVTVESNGITNAEISHVETTFWGVPAAEVNTPERGLFCDRQALEEGLSGSWGCGEVHADTGEKYGLGNEKSGITPVAFLTMPTDCATGPERAEMKADSWEEPGHVGLGGIYEGYVSEKVTMPGVTGCNLLQFSPGIEVQPDTTLADSPVELGVAVTVPQFEEPERLATPELRDATVTLPAGMSISPSIVDGVQACNESGHEGINFTGAESEEIGLNGEPQLAPGHCPDASSVGTVKAYTPLLREPVEGHIYLARPGCGGALRRPAQNRTRWTGTCTSCIWNWAGRVRWRPPA